MGGNLESSSVGGNFEKIYSNFAQIGLYFKLGCIYIHIYNMHIYSFFYCIDVRRSSESRR